MKISIITTSYNSVKTIEDTIKSVLGQVGVELEYIIVDGASTDGTMDIVNQYKDRIAKIVSEPDKSMYDAMNKGIVLATGEVVGILNSDDVYTSNDILKTVIEEMEKTKADSLWGNLVYVKADNLNEVVRNYISGPFVKGSFKKGWHPPHPTFFVKKSVYEKYGAFRTDMSTWADYEIMLRFLEKKNISNTFLDKVLVRMREGGRSNESAWHQMKANFGCYQAFKINGLSVNPIFILRKPLAKLKQFFQLK